jgi:hypothetical protein
MDKISHRNKKMRIIIFILICVTYISLLFLYNPDDENLGEGFIYNAERKDILGTVDIPPYVLSFAYDKKNIIAKQKPKKYNEAIYDKREYNYPLGRDTIYYWLIIKKEQKIFGPLNISQYDSLRIQYKVPKELVLH